MVNTLIYISADQLFHSQSALSIDDQCVVLMFEDTEFLLSYKFHKHKLIFIISAMRQYFQQLNVKKKFYFKLNLDNASNTLENNFKKIITDYPTIDEIRTYKNSNRKINKRITTFSNKFDLKYNFIDNPSFLTSSTEFKNFHISNPSLLMHNFYKLQRKKFNILISSDSKPKGGKWSHDHENRLKLPKNLSPKLPDQIKYDDIVSQVKKEIDQVFPKNPGSTSNFWLPVTRSQSLTWLNLFFEERFKLFGPYEDAIHTEHPFIYHSVVSPIINIGLITPLEVVNLALNYSEHNDVPIQSLEGFIRQIIGWREFMKGIYDISDDTYINSNFFNHKNKLTNKWYDGTTGIPPLDDMISQLNKYGYAHHIQRLMIASNLMTLCEIDPKDAFRWFMEYFVDSDEWVMEPNLIGMGLFADGGLFATKPYISSSNYILKMSNYTKKSHGSTWIDIWQALFWRFIHKNYNYFKESGRMGYMISHINKMGKEQIQNYYNVANEFIKNITE